MAMTVQMLLKDETCWTRGAFARNRVAQEVPPQDPEAVRWCLAGAIQQCYADDTARADALSRVAGCILRHYGTRDEVCWKGTALEITTYFNDAEERFASRAAHFAAVRRIIAEADLRLHPRTPRRFLPRWTLLLMLCLLWPTGLWGAPQCHLEWTAVTTTTDGQTVAVADVTYNVYVVHIAEAFVPGQVRATTPQTRIPCEAVGFTSGMQAAVTAVYVPTGQESIRSNVLIWLTLSQPVNLHLDFQPAPGPTAAPAR